MTTRPDPSLAGRGIRLLSLREHSRAELARKLAPHAESPEALDAVLDKLQQAGWLSDERFVASLVRRRQAREGTARILHTLRQHQLPREVLEEVAGDLRSTEVARAQDVWERKFGQPPADPRERARQMRFLASRGFSGDTVRRVLERAGSRADASDDESFDGD